MVIGRFIIALGLVLTVLFLGAAFYAYNQCDNQPIVVARSELASPDRTWVATLETVDNGLGFGQGALYDEVHIHRPNESVSSHGDPGESVVFYIEATGAPDAVPHLVWRDATHLIVNYYKRRSAEHRPGKHLTSFHGISIELQQR